MEDSIIDKIILNSQKQIRWAAGFTKKRYLFGDAMGIDSEYFVGIKGLRGIGKTVMMLQMAKETKDSVYLSADSTTMKPFSIYDIIAKLVKRGFSSIFIDEIHRKSGWDTDVKSIYDEHEARVVFSGSSALDITRTAADLSRRVVLKELLPVSLREYMNINKGMDLPPAAFNEILENKSRLAVKHAGIHEHIGEYMKYGGVLYPRNGFFEAMGNAIRKVVLQDLSALRDVNIKYETDVYKLLYTVAKSPPFETNYSSIASALEVSKTMAVRIVSDLQGTGLIKVVFPCASRGVNVKKEPKIYLSVPLREFFAESGIEVDKGAMREEFFVNHACGTGSISGKPAASSSSGGPGICYIKGGRGEKTPDFRCMGVTIEVGGPSKTGRQHPDYIAADGLASDGDKIPLFLFGFLY